MRHHGQIRRSLLTALGALLIGCAHNAGQQSADFAFVGVNIGDPDTGRIRRDQNVLIEADRIVAIGAGLPLPEGATQIDGQGRYLVPGLAEMHAHVPKAAEGDGYLADMLFLFVANGVTTVRGMNGEASHLDLRERILRDSLPSPRLITAGPPFIGKGAGSPAQASAAVRSQAAAGFDFIKVHMGLDAEVYGAIAAAARDEGIVIAGHVAEGVGLMRALDAGQASIDHLDAYWPALVPEGTETGAAPYGLMGAPLTPYVDPRRMSAVAQATAAAQVWNAPTLSMVENFMRPAAPPDALRYMPAKMARGWQGAARGFQGGTSFDPAIATRFLQLRLELVKALHDAGAGILLASDAPQILNVPGFSIHRELELLVAAGLTPAEAIAAGTTEAARFLGRQNEFGRVAVGYSADLILLRRNPFEDVSALREPMGVMLRGMWLPADVLEARLADIARRNSARD